MNTRHKAINEKRIGQRFFKLTVKQFHSYRKSTLTDRRRAQFLCICDCGNERIITYDYLLSTKHASCGCANKGSEAAQWRGSGELTGKKFSQYRTGAKTRHLKFEISVEFAWSVLVQQAGKCAISGQNISLKNNTASLDRINSKIGYIKSNIQWVHPDINKMKQDLEEVRFIKNCMAIAEFQGNK